jgi:hypothetical protein
MKLKIMRIRAKISLMAFEKNKSVNELFLDSIAETYDLFLKKGYYKQDNIEKLLIKEGIYYSLLYDNFNSIFQKIVIMNKTRKELQEYIESLDENDPKFLENIETKYKELNFRVRMGLKLTSDVVD